MPRSRTRTGQFVAGVLSAVAVAAVLGGVPVLLVALGGNPLPGHLPGWAAFRDGLLHKDLTGALFIRALDVVGWLAWACFALAIVVEVVARLRRRRAVRLPGLATPQRLAAGLVAAIALTFASPAMAEAHTPRAPAAVATAPGTTTATAPGSRVTITLPAGPGHTARPAAAGGPHASRSSGRLVYRVHHGDYLGIIAERFGFDFDAATRIAKENHIADPNFIETGWRIVLPAGAHDQGPRTHATGHLVAPPAPPPGPSHPGGTGHTPAPPTTPGTPAPTPAPATPTPGATHAGQGAGAQGSGEHSSSIGDIALEALEVSGTLAAVVALALVAARRRDRHNADGTRPPGVAPAGAGPAGGNGNRPTRSDGNAARAGTPHAAPLFGRDSDPVVFTPAAHQAARAEDARPAAPAGPATPDMPAGPAMPDMPAGPAAPAVPAEAVGMNTGARRGPAWTADELTWPPADGPVADTPPAGTAMPAGTAVPPGTAAPAVVPVPGVAVPLVAGLFDDATAPATAPPRLMAPTRAADIVRLDTALRLLGDQVQEWPVSDVPQVAGVWLDRGALTLLLADECGAPPAPFVDDPNGWLLPAEVPIRRAGDQLAPLPALCTVGGRSGQHVLLDLEYLRVLGIGGDPAEAMNLLRFIAVELCHNVWSDDVRITLAGFGAEGPHLAAIDPGRFRLRASVAEAIAAFGAQHAGAVADLDDVRPPEVLMLANPTRDDQRALARLEEELVAAPGVGMAVVVAPTPDDMPVARYQMAVGRAGDLHIGFLGDAIMPAASLPSVLVTEVVALIAAARAAGDTSPLDLARAASLASLATAAVGRAHLAGQHRRDAAGGRSFRRELEEQTSGSRDRRVSAVGTDPAAADARPAPEPGSGMIRHPEGRMRARTTAPVPRRGVSMGDSAVLAGHDAPESVTGAPVDPAVPASGSGAGATPRDPRWVRPAVLVIAALAGVAYGWAADRLSVEMYYAGAVRTMAHDWHAFVFGGFDSAGTISLDKLPGAFWIQALVVRVFGMSTVSLVAPQVVAGVVAVVALFRAVRRVAGARAGVVAAAVLAATPAAAVASRGNTADGICTLLLILAADATMRAIMRGRVRSLVLAAVYVGLAFQAKMVEAWAILPGLGAAYLIAASGRLRRRFALAGAGAAVVAAVSLSWMIAVSLVPAGDRPYVDGSPGNSVFYQVFAYNGVNRFGGDQRSYGLGAHLPYRPSDRAVERAAAQGVATTPGADGSEPGALRLVTGPVGRDAGWLLPAAFVALFGGLVSRVGRPRADPLRAALVVWGVWLSVFVVAFNHTSHLLSYYTGLLAPAVAALCAIGLRLAYGGLREPTDGRRRRTKITAVVVATTLAGTAAVEVLLTRSTPGWLSITTLGVAGIVVAALVAGVRAGSVHRRAGLLVAAAALLVPPVGALAGMVAGGGGSFDAPYVPGGTLAHPDPRSADAPVGAPYGGVIQPVTGGRFWDGLSRSGDAMTPYPRTLVFTSAEASSLVAAGVTGVVAIGGFTGLVPSPGAGQVRTMIEDNQVGWALVPGPEDLRANDPRILVITSLCRPAPVPSLGAQPDSAGPAWYWCHR